MKKTFIITFASALLILSACQNSPDNTRNAADQSKNEKAVTSAQINLVVNPPAGSTDESVATSSTDSNSTDQQPSN